MLAREVHQDGLSFDEATHTYTLRGRKLPSVTQVIEPLVDLSHVPDVILADASAFGRAVHRATELDDQEDLIEDALDPRIVPYLNAWRRFRAELGVTLIAIEERLFHPALGFAGTLDRRVRIGDCPQPWVIDLKTGSTLHPTFGLQTAAYATLAELATGTPHKRAVVQLRNDGTYRLKPLDDRRDWPTFVAALTVLNWRQSHAR